MNGVTIRCNVVIKLWTPKPWASWMAKYVTLPQFAYTLSLERKSSNLIVTAGKNHLATFLHSASAISYMNFLGLGTGASEAQLTDTILEAEPAFGAGYARVAATSSAALNVLTKTGTFAAGQGTGTIREVGVFSAATAGTMFARNSGFSPFVKGAGDIMEMRWDIHFD